MDVVIESWCNQFYIQGNRQIQTKQTDTLYGNNNIIGIQILLLILASKITKT